MRPFTLLIKPSGPDCNIACRYCFYTRKTEIFGTGAHRMSTDILEQLVKDYLQLRLESSCFAWQGGEPTLMGLGFYKKLVNLQQKYGADGQVVTNSLQTNGILLDDEWCQFLTEYRFLVGISLDGPKKYHDHYRLDHAGKGTFDKVTASIERCRKAGVDFNILVLLSDHNVGHPDELFDFFIDKKIRFLQFIQCVEQDPKTGQIADFSITPEQYGDFMCRIFDRWQQYGQEKISIRTFDSVVAFCLGLQHTECTFMPKCSDYIVIEHNGDAFCCDFFVEEAWRLGNITETPIDKLAGDKRKRTFAQRKRKLADKCLVCRHLDVCRGGCPKDRLHGAAGIESPTYFCEGYRRFFDHTMPKFWEIAAKLNAKP